MHLGFVLKFRMRLLIRCSVCVAVINYSINETLKPPRYIVDAFGTHKLRRTGNSRNDRLQYILPGAFTAQGLGSRHLIVNHERRMHLGLAPLRTPTTQVLSNMYLTQVVTNKQLQMVHSALPKFQRHQNVKLEHVPHLLNPMKPLFTLPRRV
jgi:hypothetical protein